ESLDLSVERCSEFRARDCDGDYFRGLRQPAAGFEVLVVETFRRVDIDAKGAKIEPVSFPAGRDRPFQICINLRWLELVSLLVQRNFHACIFELHQALTSAIQREIGKTIGRCGNKHAQTPFIAQTSRAASV